jgi:hypothetical protein
MTRDDALTLKKQAKKVGVLLNPRRFLCYFPARIADFVRDRSLQLTADGAIRHNVQETTNGKKECSADEVGDSCPDF